MVVQVAVTNIPTRTMDKDRQGSLRDDTIMMTRLVVMAKIDNGQDYNEGSLQLVVQMHYRGELSKPAQSGHP
jgi:hypothetical protein